MRCIGCKTPGTYWCNACEQDYNQVMSDVRGVIRALGSEYDEGVYVLAAQRLIDESTRPDLTGFYKSLIVASARELLASVEDHFLYTPVCSLCGVHKMVVITAPQPGVTCTGGCKYGA